MAQPYGTHTAAALLGRHRGGSWPRLGSTRGASPPPASTTQGAGERPHRRQHGAEETRPGMTKRYRSRSSGDSDAGPVAGGPPMSPACRHAALAWPCAGARSSAAEEHEGRPASCRHRGVPVGDPGGRCARSLGTAGCPPSLRSPTVVCIGLLLLGAATCAQSQPVCSGGVPCVVDKGGGSFDNSEYISTAVGCSKTVNVKFGSALDATSSPTISMCERDAEGVCKYKSGVILNQFQRECCAKAFVQRSRSCIAPTMADDPNGVFQCIQLSYTIEPGHTTAHVTFFGAYGTDLINGGQVEACLTASHGNGTQVQRPTCSCSMALAFRMRVRACARACALHVASSAYVRAHRMSTCACSLRVCMGQRI